MTDFNLCLKVRSLEILSIAFQIEIIDIVFAIKYLYDTN